MKRTPSPTKVTMTPYFQSMVRAYRIAVEFARANGIELTTIHPAAVYGGRNTGGGITDYMENLASRNWHRLPFINPSSFPVVHVDLLTDAVIKSLNVPGAFIASDQMTSLKDIAQSMRKQVWSYVPLVLPLWIVMFGVELMEAMARIIRIKPFASTVQIAFLTKGWRPDSGKAIRELGWKPLPLEDGIRHSWPRGDPRSPARGARDDRFRAGGADRETRAVHGGRAVPLLDLVLHHQCGPGNPPPGYFVFQNSFTFADLILALLLARAATYLLGGDPIRRVIGRGLSLVCAGALLFLGGLDISFNFQNEIYLTWSFDMALEIAVNIWCLGFGFLLAYDSRSMPTSAIDGPRAPPSRTRRRRPRFARLHAG